MAYVEHFAVAVAVVVVASGFAATKAAKAHGRHGLVKPTDRLNARQTDGRTDGGAAEK